MDSEKRELLLNRYELTLTRLSHVNEEIKLAESMLNLLKEKHYILTDEGLKLQDELELTEDEREVL